MTVYTSHWADDMANGQILVVNNYIPCTCSLYTKQNVYEALLLTLPNLEKPFESETTTMGDTIELLLMHERKLVAYNFDSFT